MAGRAPPGRCPGQALAPAHLTPGGGSLSDRAEWFPPPAGEGLSAQEGGLGERRVPHPRLTLAREVVYDLKRSPTAHAPGEEISPPCLGGGFADPRGPPEFSCFSFVHISVWVMQAVAHLRR